MVKKVMIMAGGTGGHVFPALAVAHALKAQGVEVRWLGTRRGMESVQVPKQGFPIDYISISGLRGKGKLSLVLAPLRLAVAMAQALKVLLRFRPHVVLGMGGFVTGPGGVMARLIGIPLVIHEQNAIAGMTNRLLSRIATRILEAFPGAFKNSQRVRHTGNPVRADIAKLAVPDERLNGREGALRLLVVGGSQGALALNQIVPEAIAALEDTAAVEVWHQCGKHNCELTQDTYSGAGIEARVEPFIDDMNTAYEWADVVVCRSGAMTVAELAAAGVGAILVPYPYAVDDHQTVNGRYLAEHGAAEIIPQAQLTVEELVKRLEEFMADAMAGRERIRKMAEQAHSLAMPNATDEVMNQCLEVMRG
ncbi:MAG: undecaprenyldiphospho-muramoylpentapeptide beta-N-acetylglucosaminyltransferase [Gammaproteobacteria bacterium]|nr:undecaprenyldiphospho-muramoylpentapeptide beta-N-acetylglucosaminyltransferase [Gammaproteobacteria bacterium]